MSNYVNLIGAEDVSRAGYAMQSAANTMQSAANSMEYSFEQQRRFMDDWLVRLSEVLEKKED